MIAPRLIMVLPLSLALSISGVGLTLTGLQPTLQMALHQRFRLFAVPPATRSPGEGTRSWP